MPMTKPPIAEMLEKVDCCYTLVVETAKRARALVGGSQPLIDTKETKPIVIAIDEIHRGLVSYSRNMDELIEKDEKQMKEQEEREEEAQEQNQNQ